MHKPLLLLSSTFEEMDVEKLCQSLELGVPDPGDTSHERSVLPAYFKCSINAGSFPSLLSRPLGDEIHSPEELW